MRGPGRERLLDHVRHVGVGEDDHGQLLKLPDRADFLEQGDAVYFGQHQVQQQRVRLHLINPVEARLSVRGDVHLEAFLLQAAAIDVRDDGVVLDDQNFLHILVLTTAADFRGS